MHIPGLHNSQQSQHQQNCHNECGIEHSHMLSLYSLSFLPFRHLEFLYLDTHTLIPLTGAS